MFTAVISRMRWPSLMESFPGPRGLRLVFTCRFLRGSASIICGQVSVRRIERGPKFELSAHRILDSGRSTSKSEDAHTSGQSCSGVLSREQLIYRQPRAFWQRKAPRRHRRRMPLSFCAFGAPGCCEWEPLSHGLSEGGWLSWKA